MEPAWRHHLCLHLFWQEEKEKARAQKDEVVTQVTEVLENELQCIICSELFIEVGLQVCVAYDCTKKLHSSTTVIKTEF